MTEEELQELVQSGDPDAIDKYLAGTEINEEEFTVDDKPPSTEEADDDQLKSTEEVESKETVEPVESQTAEPTPKEKEQEEGEAGVLTEDGKNTIPFSVLKDARSRANSAESELSDTKAQLVELQSQLENSGKLQRSYDLMIKQLEEHGIEPETPLEDMVLTDELKQELISDYGVLGKLVVQQMEKAAPAESATAESNASANEEQSTDNGNPMQEMNDAIGRNDALKAWAKEGNDLWQEAKRIDQVLRSDPKFINSSYDERFAEVERVVKAMHGIDDTNSKGSDLKKDAEDVIKEAEDKSPPPTSLSDLGVSTTHAENSLVDRLNNMGDDQMRDSVMDMSSDKLDQIFDQF